MLLPQVKWAQRPGVVYLTIDVQDAKDPQIDLTNSADGKHGHLMFKSAKEGAAGDGYALELDLFGGVDTDKSKISVSPRQVFLVLEKTDAESWPRLTKESSKHLSHIKVDWDKWVDSDDEGDDTFDPNMFGQLNGLGGMGGGMGGMGGMGMPGMEGMGGMGGMPPGMGGMAGLESLLGGAGGMGAMGGMAGLEGMDLSSLGAAAGGAGDTAGVEEDSDDESLPELEA